MANLTLAIEDSLIRDARRVAFERETTLTEMIRGYLREVVKDLDAERESKARQLLETIERNSFHVGKINWTRDELYERNE